MFINYIQLQLSVEELNKTIRMLNNVRDNLCREISKLAVVSEVEDELLRLRNVDKKIESLTDFTVKLSTALQKIYEVHKKTEQEAFKCIESGEIQEKPGFSFSEQIVGETDFDWSIV